MGNKMVFSWGTNWTGYVLQSSTSASPGATWAKVTTTPVKVGNLYRVTNSMSGVRFYRLVHP
ncbi:hypothetical protein [Pedosphaera parvula]|uniref:hypothetical protein n=1 Tax=Pedosphaera parvula TaxID=1032527 RepID=UPI00135F130E|nr:hypothetical protein [Pedosphaera parvula]